MAFAKNVGQKNMYGICRIQKYKNNTIRGIENHLERRNTTTNPDIEKHKSKDNYDLTGQQDRTLKSLIKERLEKIGTTIKRKDAVTMVELLFTASPEFFENMTPNEVRSYFQKCYEFACNKYGKENIIAADVHLDEKTPHMHLELVPISKGRLCAKELFNHKLEQLQDQVHEQVFSKYNLERGDSRKKAKHISTLSYKILTLQREKAEIEADLQRLDKIRDSDKVYQLEQKFHKTQQMLDKMIKTLEQNPKAMAEFKRAIQEMKRREEQEKANEELTPML